MRVTIEDVANSICSSDHYRGRATYDEVCHILEIGLKSKVGAMSYTTETPIILDLDLGASKYELVMMCQLKAGE